MGAVCDHGVVMSRPEAAAGDSQPSAAAEARSATGLGESRWPPAAVLLVFMALNIAVRVWLPHEARGASSRGWFPRSRPSCSWCWSAATRRLARRVAMGAPRSGHPRRRACHGCVVGDRGPRPRPDQGGRSRQLTDSGCSPPAHSCGWGTTSPSRRLYWLIDSGGPIARSQDSRPVDFAFTQQMSPELAPSGWRPVFLAPLSP